MQAGRGGCGCQRAGERSAGEAFKRTPTVVAGRAAAQVVIMKSPTLDEFGAKVDAFKPTWVYLCGPCLDNEDLVNGSLAPLQFSGARAVAAGGEQQQPGLRATRATVAGGQHARQSWRRLPPATKHGRAPPPPLLLCKQAKWPQLET